MSAEDDLDLLAAELALGLLEAGEAAAAQARLAQDPELAAAHARWTGWAAGLAADLETPPPARVWSTIAARLPANDDGTLRRQLRLWQGTAIAASLAAVVLGVGWWSRPQPAPTAPAQARAGSGGVRLLDGPELSPRRGRPHGRKRVQGAAGTVPPRRWGARRRPGQEVRTCRMPPLQRARRGPPRPPILRRPYPCGGDGGGDGGGLL